MSKQQKTALLAAGGTGGHLFPAQALAAELQSRGWQVHLASDGRTEKFRDQLPQENVHLIPSATISKNPLKAIKGLLKLRSGYKQAQLLIDRLEPSVVIGFGGYPSLPPLFAARSKKVPSLIHEANAVMGRANRVLARFADSICTGFELVLPAKQAEKCRVTGNPVRPDIVKAAAQAYQASGEGEAFKLLVFGGSQGAQYFSQVLPQAISLLPFDMGMRLQIVQQAREADEAELVAFYAENEIDAEVQPFFSNMAQLLANAHFVICRAGASTCSELAAIGRPSLLVPYPFALDHDQAKNAKAMADVGAALVQKQSDLSAQRLCDLLLNAMQKPDELAKRAAAAKSVGQLNAAALLADACEAIS